jgi:hypothetical protein
MNEDQGFKIIRQQEPAAPPQDDAPFKIVTPEVAKKVEDELRPPRSFQDVAGGLAKTVRSEVARGVPSLVGAPGSVETFLAKDLPTFARGVGLAAAEKMDIVSPKQAEEMGQKPLPWVRESEAMPGVVEKGYVSPLLGLPTYKGAKKVMGDVYKSVGRPESAYEPQTGPEKVLAAGIEGAVQSVPGRLATMPGRAITGGGAGAAAETAGLVTEGQSNEPFWRLASALGGGYAGSKVANALLPATVGRDRIAAALVEDLRKGETPMSFEQVQAAIREGTPVTLVDMAGPRTLTLISRMGDVSPSTQTRVGLFNKHLIDRSSEAGTRVGEVIRDTVGVPRLDADALQQANAVAGSRIRDVLWKTLEGSPAAGSIPIASPKLANSDNFQTAVKRATDRAGELPDSFNIRPPSVTPGKPGVEERILQTPTGLQKFPGQAEVAPQVTPGNLPFYHQVDRELSAMIKAAERTGDNQLVAGYKATQNTLRDELDRIMLRGGSNQTYREVVGASRKTFVGEEAPQAGYEFASSLISSRKNPFKRGDVRREFDAMDPENKEYLRLGVAARIQDGVESGQLSHIAKKFATDETFRRDMQHVLGPEAYNRISGAVMRESLINQADTIRFLSDRITPTGVGLTAAGVVSAGDVLSSIIQGANVASALGASVDAKTVMAGLGAMGIKYASSLAERRIAESTLPLALSKDPNDIARFGELVSNYPQVKDFYNRLTVTLTQGINSVAEGLEKQDKAEPPKRAFGGRIAKKTGGSISRNHEADAERLIAKAEKAKRMHSTKTKPLLKSDDNQIAKALEIANRNLEG